MKKYKNKFKNSKFKMNISLDNPNNESLSIFGQSIGGPVAPVK